MSEGYGAPIVSEHEADDARDETAAGEVEIEGDGMVVRGGAPLGRQAGSA